MFGSNFGVESTNVSAQSSPISESRRSPRSAIACDWSSEILDAMNTGGGIALRLFRFPGLVWHDVSHWLANLWRLKTRRWIATVTIIRSRCSTARLRLPAVQLSLSLFILFFFSLFVFIPSLSLFSPYQTWRTRAIKKALKKPNKIGRRNEEKKENIDDLVLLPNTISNIESLYNGAKYKEKKTKQLWLREYRLLFSSQAAIFTKVRHVQSVKLINS